MDVLSELRSHEKYKCTPTENTPASLKSNDSGYQSFGPSSSPPGRRRLRCRSNPAYQATTISPHFEETDNVFVEGVSDAKFQLPRVASRRPLRSLKHVPKLSLEEFVDIFHDLQPFPQVVRLILSYLSPRDLCAMNCVSSVWQKTCCSDPLANRRRLEFLKQEALCRAALGKENLCAKRPLSSANANTPLLDSGNIRLPNAELNSPAPLPQSNFQKFLEAGQSLPSDGRLTSCIHCKSPSQMSQGSTRASCMEAGCALVFCIRCWRQYEDQHKCPSSRTPPRRTNARISSKTSKKNLQRLVK